jgi:hypothetical protein
VQEKLKEEMEKVDKTISGWGVTDNTHTKEQKALALAALQREGNYYRSLLAQARTQAANHENQQADSSPFGIPQLRITISSSASAKTSGIHLTQGAALKQARNVEEQNDWSSVLNEN